MHQIREFFPDAGQRPSNGKTWAGYYFCVTSKDFSAWFGYVLSKHEIEAGAKHEAELIAVTSFPATLSQDDFRPLVLRNKAFLGAQRVPHAWAINYDGNWKNPERWRSALEPLNEQWQKLATATAEGGGPGAL